MLQIPNEFKKNGYNYKLLQRDANVCMYELCQGSVTAYEVHKIKIQNEGKMFIHSQMETIIFPEKERLSSNEGFGRSAWSYSNIDIAKQKYLELLGISS